jgi:hypothetical protein
MKNDRLLIIIFSLITIISCTQKSSEQNEIIIDSEKSKKWNLPELNAKVKIPKEYKLTFNDNDGFYFQAHKYDENNILLAEISFGRIEGEFKKENIMKALKEAENGIIEQFSSIKQVDYQTTFLGKEKIGDLELSQLRGIVEFNNFNVVFDGKFHSFTTPILLDEKNRIMISAIIRDSERLDNKTSIGIELINIIQSIKQK